MLMNNHDTCFIRLTPGIGCVECATKNDTRIYNKIEQRMTRVMLVLSPL